jgi:hypothetical protein
MLLFPTNFLSIACVIKADIFTCTYLFTLADEGYGKKLLPVGGMDRSGG